MCTKNIYVFKRKHYFISNFAHKKKYRHNLRPHAAWRFFSLNINTTRTRSQFIFLIQCAARDKCAFDPSAINECGLNCLGIFWYAPYHATIQNNDSLTTSHHVCARCCRAEHLYNAMKHIMRAVCNDERRRRRRREKKKTIKINIRFPHLFMFWIERRKRATSNRVLPPSYTKLILKHKK